MKRSFLVAILAIAASLFVVAQAPASVTESEASFEGILERAAPSGQDGGDICAGKDQCWDPPPPPPPPPPNTPDYAAYGWHGDITPDGHIRGWACDPNDFNYPIFIHFYADNGRGWHGYIGQTQAGGWWNEGVAQACGGNPWHGYTFRIPDWIRNGEGYQVYSYAINICGSACEQGNPRQSGDGAIFGFGTPADLNSAPHIDLSGNSDYSTYSNNPCGTGRAYKYAKTLTRSKGLGLWHKKVKLHMVWCGNPLKTRIVGWTATVWTEHGSWCSNSSPPTATRTDGGMTYPYVEMQVVNYVSCASWPFNIPSFGDTLWFRTRFYPDRRYVTVAHD
jgi:hypothetical protein